MPCSRHFTTEPSLQPPKHRLNHFLIIISVVTIMNLALDETFPLFISWPWLDDVLGAFWSSASSVTPGRCWLRSLTFPSGMLWNRLVGGTEGSFLRTAFLELLSTPHTEALPARVQAAIISIYKKLKTSCWKSVHIMVHATITFLVGNLCCCRLLDRISCSPEWSP